jgi:hypothetical protein
VDQRVSVEKRVCDLRLLVSMGKCCAQGGHGGEIHPRLGALICCGTKLLLSRRTGKVVRDKSRIRAALWKSDTRDVLVDVCG